jgi:hypothetical protein
MDRAAKLWYDLSLEEGEGEGRTGEVWRRSSRNTAAQRVVVEGGGVNG